MIANILKLLGGIGQGSVVRCLAVVFCALTSSSVLSGIVLSDEFSVADSRALAADYDRYPAFESVGKVNIEEGGSHFLGTGTLIARDWVLTAAHNWNYDAITGMSFSVGGSSYEAIRGQWRQHPHWEFSPAPGLTQPWDFGLFQLDTPVTNIEPAVLSNNQDVLGAKFFMLGYGLTGTGSSGAQPGTFGSLHAAQNILDRTLNFQDGGSLLFSDFDNGSPEANVLGRPGIYDERGMFLSGISVGTLRGDSSRPDILPFEGTTAAGDSGGPAFVDFGSGLELVGVSSWGVNPSGPTDLYSSEYGDLAVFVGVDDAAEWIYAVIPEPGRMALFAGVIASFFVLVQRRKYQKSSRIRKLL